MDELFAFFLAGFKTIQISTTNLIYYITKHPEIKAILMDEILPPVEKVKENILEGLNYDTVMEFEYLQNCYNESLRIEPPASVSILSTTIQDTVIGYGGAVPITFKKGHYFQILFNEIHHDPVQWREPQLFEPNRFDTRTPNNKWALTTEGKPRNPLSFTPFFGGKRICLGKTFVETTIKFTVPLIFHHVDFVFVNPEIQS